MTELLPEVVTEMDKLRNLAPDLKKSKEEQKKAAGFIQPQHPLQNPPEPRLLLHELLGPDLLHRALHTLGHHTLEHHTLGLGQQREILLPLLRQVQAVTAAPG
jgi:hypothetical protein